MPSRSDLAKIHIAKQDLELDEATYRSFLKERYGLESAADLTPGQAADLVDRFRAKGWRPASAGQIGLIRVLWHKLAQIDAVRHDDSTALDAFVAHLTGRGNGQQLTVHEASKVIEMLKQWRRRLETSDRRH